MLAQIGDAGTAAAPRPGGEIHHPVAAAEIGRAVMRTMPILAGGRAVSQSFADQLEDQRWRSVRADSGTGAPDLIEADCFTMATVYLRDISVERRD